MKKIAIIGAGASGLVCAIAASKNNNVVKVFEKNSKIARKVLATGNGRCNISNQNISPNRYHSENPSFIKDVLKGYDTQFCKSFFKNLGLEIIEKEDGKLYPMSLQSSSVVDMLINEARALEVEFLLGCEVTQVCKSDEGFELFYDDKKEFFDVCVIATGSPAMPNLGSSESGYAFAKNFGHKIVDIVPSLVQLVSENQHIKEASGVKIEAKISLFIFKDLVQARMGDLLFAPYGLSGSAILELSQKASKALNLGHSVSLQIDMMPDFNKDELEGFLKKRQAISKNLPLVLWLEGMMPKKLAILILKTTKLDANVNASKIGIKELKRLVFCIKNFEVKISDTKGIQSAEVCSGGVCVSEICSKTLMSKKVNNLYFCGEVLDVDGDCGGFNLHFAWTTGHRAGQSI